MNKLQLVRYILNHSDELKDWYCNKSGNDKDGFDMPEPDELTLNDVTTHGTGYWGDTADMLIDDALSEGIITEEMLE